MGSFNSFLSKFGGGGVADGEPSSPVMLSASAPTAFGAFMDKFSTLTESYWFYDSTIELRFDTKNHKYYKVDPELGNLIEQHGVTNTVHIIDRSVALIPWAVKKAAEKLLRTAPVVTRENGLFVAEMKLEEFTKLVMEAKDAHREILVEAGDIGHLAHKCLEDSIQYAIDNTDGIVHELRNLPDDEKAVSCAQAALAWMKQHNVRWIKTEQKIYSREHEYAGTMDGLALVDSCDDPSCCAKAFKNHRSLIDWKSSNYLYIEYCFQTASYQQAEQEEFCIPIDDRWILRLGKNEEEAGKFEPWYLAGDTFAEDFAGFLECLRLKKLVESVDVRMRVQKKGVREAKKQQKAEQKAIAKMKAKVEKEAERAKKKLERAEERERIKAEAKRNREEAKRTKAAGVLHDTETSKLGEGYSTPTRSREADSTGQSLQGRNEYCPVESTPDSRNTDAALVSSATAQTSETTESCQALPVRTDVRDATQRCIPQPDNNVAEGSGPVVDSESLVEEKVQHKPFVIPEEG